jgi:hypothetical protein
MAPLHNFCASSHLLTCNQRLKKAQELKCTIFPLPQISSGKLSHLRNAALSEIVWALACWQYTPGKKWLREYFRVTMPKLTDFKPMHLANTILALKKLNCKVGEFC